ncbi:hypothetical protein ACM43_09380 [Bradyrhizobium sp. CCBAU 45321]|nr:hypothetical protein [Bradyrhizobium sp. CCBAU 45321]
MPAWLRACERAIAPEPKPSETIHPDPELLAAAERLQLLITAERQRGTDESLAAPLRRHGGRSIMLLVFNYQDR